MALFFVHFIILDSGQFRIHTCLVKVRHKIYWSNSRVARLTLNGDYATTSNKIHQVKGFTNDLYAMKVISFLCTGWRMRDDFFNAPDRAGKKEVVFPTGRAGPAKEK